jgi:cell division protein FtsW (lipid II flippase)
MASRAESGIRVRETASHAKRMSNHIAYALVVYTLLLIFEVSPQMESKGTSILPYFILVVLVALVILPCRNLERRWQALDTDGRGNHHAQFKRDLVALWLAAIGIPTGLMALIWIIP